MIIRSINHTSETDKTTTHVTEIQVLTYRLYINCRALYERREVRLSLRTNGEHAIHGRGKKGFGHRVI